MKILLKLLLALAASQSMYAVASVTTQIIELDASKPIILNIQTRNLGPEFQCYYGFIANKNQSAFPVILNTKKLDIDNNYEFSNMFEFLITDPQKIEGFEFASLVECWVTGEKNILASSAQFTVELQQDKSGPVLFKDSFSGFIQNGNFDLWTKSPREVIKRIKFKLK